jgi:hypothetical protein
MDVLTPLVLSKPSLGYPSQCPRWRHKLTAPRAMAPVEIGHIDRDREGRFSTPNAPGLSHGRCLDDKRCSAASSPQRGSGHAETKASFRSTVRCEELLITGRLVRCWETVLDIRRLPTVVVSGSWRSPSSRRACGAESCMCPGSKYMQPKSDARERQKREKKVCGNKFLDD